MVFSIALAVAMSFDGANCSCPSADVLFTCQAPAPQGQQQDPTKPIFNPPAAPLGETLPGAEAELGGNPAPIPTTKYFLEQTLSGWTGWKNVEDLGIRVYGWTQGNVSFSSTNDSNAPTTFNDRADYAQMNQNWLEIVRAVDPSKAEFQVGGRITTILPGYDYKYTLARGMWNHQSDRYGFDTPYVYAELFVPGIGPKGSTVRVGKWGTTIGYEMIEAIATPFVSRSYNFQYNPFTHTGAQVTTELNSNFTMYHGVVTGADVFFDPAATPSYVGGLKWTRDGGKTSVAANVFITGRGFDEQESFQHYDSYNVLLQHQLAEGWNYVLDATYGRAADTAGTSDDTNWLGFANYLSHNLNEQTVLNLRAEWFRDSDGARTGTRGSYVAVTVGAQWSPMEWLMVRPFLRFDRNSNGPFEGDDDMFSGGLEAVLRW